MRFLIVRKRDADIPYGALSEISFESLESLEMFVMGMGGKAKIVFDTYDDFGNKGLPFICEIDKEEE